MRPRVLVAGVGNLFLGDDGFGVEVARRLASVPLPPWVRVADFGIRTLHLAYDLLEGAYEITILVDATVRGDKPGTVYLIEPDMNNISSEKQPVRDAHSMSPETVFGLVRRLGGTPGRVLIVGCEPERADDVMGLSEPVKRGVDEAAKLVLEILQQEGCRQ